MLCFFLTRKLIVFEKINNFNNEMLTKLRMNMLNITINNLIQEEPAEKKSRGCKLNRQPLMALKRSM